MKKLLSAVIAFAMIITCMLTAACSPKTVESISVTDTTLTCYVGDEFDTGNINLEIKYSDGSSENKTVKAAGATATAVDTSTAGNKTVTITLGEAVTTATVTVKENGGSEDFSYYANTKLPADKKIYLIDELTNADDLFSAQAVQGLMARNSASIYVNSHTMTNGLNVDTYYLNSIAEKYGLEVTEVTLAEAVEKYKAAWSANVADGVWGSGIPMESFVQKQFNAYVEGEDYTTPGYIIYKRATYQVNLAATLAGITGFIPVEVESEAKFQEMGLVKKFDLNNAAFTYRWLFNVPGMMDELSPKGLIHQNYKEDGTTSTNKFIKDYGIYNKFFHIYYDPASAISEAVKKNVHSFLNPNVPIFGYTYSEDADVAFFSQYGQFIVPTDYTCNLTFLAAEEFAGQKFNQPNNDADKPAQSGKHYVAFVVSDGDNATYWQNTAQFASNYMNAAGREKDNFPVTWSMTPSLADLMPSVLDNVYNKQSNEYDYFCAPVSGHGYINAGNFAAQQNGEYFADFCSKLDIYMGKADLSTVTVIGGSGQGDLPGVLRGYAGCSNVKGGIVYEGGKYFGSVRGGVMWVNGKPFIGPRDSLWETTPAYIAARINQYEKDITSVDGYTLVNVHPWSHSYEDIRTIVNMLNDDVEVVSVDRLVKMMTDNITDKSNTTTFKIPEKNGVSISENDLREHPELIPVDPLFNDFLLWAEDWSGSGVSYNNSDPACSNVGAMYKGNITIAAGSTATKTPFNLPDIDNYWLSFNARCDSTSPSVMTAFNLYMTVGTERKLVMSNVEMRGVSGTETVSVNGDGWQCFAFPIKQYFADYKTKECRLEIEVTGSTGIRLDQVKFTDRTLDSSIDQTQVDPYNNQFESTTEDWMLGEQYKTSQYFWWDVIDREDPDKHVNAIQIDCSDGGGDEKRNGNTNIWMAKNYVLPEADGISVSFEVASDNDKGAMLKISMYVNGEYIVLFDWNTARASKNNTNVTVNLSELYPDIDFSGAEVTVVFEARDGGNNNGSGEACSLKSFVTRAN